MSGEDVLLLQTDRYSEELSKELMTLEYIRKIEETDDGLKLIAAKHSQLLSKVVQAAESHHVKIIKVHVHTPSLEDVFLHLTGRMLRD